VRSSSRLLIAAAALCATTLVWGAMGAGVRAQAPGAAAAAQPSDVRIWAGVYTTAQAGRGRTIYEAYCTRCHGLNLLGGRGAGGGPALKDAGFWLSWERSSLGNLYSKISRTMPLDSPASLRDDDYTDVLAYILAENTFPAGSVEITPTVNLAEIRIMRKAGEVSEAPNFAVVQVVGCLAPGPNSTWTLTRASAPLATRDETPSEAALKDAGGLALGTGTFRLVGAGRFDPASRAGQKMEARGLLNRRSESEQIIDVLSLRSVGATCG
jgi:mono/diheme cytochrome c family protein